MAKARKSEIERVREAVEAGAHVELELDADGTVTGLVWVIKEDV